MKQTLYFLFIFIFINSNFLTADTLPDCPSDKKQVYHNCFGTHSDPGISYTGEWQNNKMNGMGTISFENGASYTGDDRALPNLAWQSLMDNYFIYHLYKVKFFLWYAEIKQIL